MEHYTQRALRNGRTAKSPICAIRTARLFGTAASAGYMRFTDPDVAKLARLEAVEKLQGKRPQVVGDLRRALDDKSVDAICVSTPDHWHALATVWGCQAGKHVYVEKPISHTPWEGRKMVEAARRYNRVVQAGTQVAVRRTFTKPRSTSTAANSAHPYVPRLRPEAMGQRAARAR